MRFEGGGEEGATKMRTKRGGPCCHGSRVTAVDPRAASDAARRPSGRGRPEHGKPRGAGSGVIKACFLDGILDDFQIALTNWPWLATRGLCRVSAVHDWVGQHWPSPLGPQQKSSLKPLHTRGMR